jgi:hypothetical protein
MKMPLNLTYCFQIRKSIVNSGSFVKIHGKENHRARLFLNTGHHRTLLPQNVNNNIMSAQIYQWCSKVFQDYKPIPIIIDRSHLLNWSNSLSWMEKTKQDLTDHTAIGLLNCTVLVNVRLDQILIQSSRFSEKHTICHIHEKNFQSQ